ncbi:alpha/beta fold hydrolase [Arthrobacter sp. zg-Y820]|uniref:alpha/beta hydrolase family protein n=1 Tax=unclassified Arthrobacter TaxID=235627 RepID=UPI001E2C507B|nr:MULTISPECIES: alpha/beta fold hydrolase [unclassified Arthrobacter]MCC9196917.1 alpha/beta fold hydrolase [Arthrobacter sp. zg-Y820]MDK1279781.1 alpha/beta fold hydrolase [Arthrobacter sp. zg.Y820]WIB10966.1 alpha/beta fold hydrolase [Arthrobacter sp. zg-Y820]
MPNKNVFPTTSDRIRVPVAGGGAVAGTLRIPVGASPVAAVAIHPATAVAERLYTGFAEYLAENGFAVFTYDYRGTGASGSPKANRTLRMRDWMFQDVPAVAAWMAGRFPDLPQLAVGHSIGGHALVLNNGTAGLSGFVAVASHGGVTRAIENRRERIRVTLVLRVLGPLAARVLGFVPGKRMGLGEDMPGAAMLEWSRWSRMPGYFFDDPGMRASERAAKVDTDVFAIGFSDDPWATPKQIDAVYGCLVNAAVERRTYTPDDGGVPAIGHMGFFRRGVRDTLWPQVRDWLSERAGT